MLLYYIPCILKDNFKNTTPTLKEIFFTNETKGLYGVQIIYNEWQPCFKFSKRVVFFLLYSLVWAGSYAEQDLQWTRFSCSYFLAQEVVNDAKCEQISEELSGEESTKWPQFCHAEDERLMGLISKDPSLFHTLGF